MSTVTNNDGNTAKPGSENAQAHWLSFFQNNAGAFNAMAGQLAANGGNLQFVNGVSNAFLLTGNFMQLAQSWNSKDWKDLKALDKANNIMNASGAALSTIAGFMPERDSLSGLYGNLSQSTESMVDSLGSLLPGMAGAIYSAANGASDLLAGAFGDALTTSGNSKSDAIMDAIPVLGLLNAGLGNAVGNNKIDNLSYDLETWSTMGGSYAGAQSTVKDAAENTGGRYGILSKLTGEFKKDQDLNRSGQLIQETVSKIGEEAKAALEVASSTLLEAILNERKRLQGTNATLSVRKGMKLPTKGDIQKTKNLFKEINEGIPEFIPDYSILYNNDMTSIYKDGGKMNIIPEGELHARLHHMKLEGITKKGIPVISEEEGGEIIQHAEIERNEIIFRLEVTKKLEELMEDGSEEAALEAGKLLADEILNNTEDRTGLLNEVE